MWDLRLSQCCCWRFKNSVICLLYGCAVPLIQETCSGCTHRVKLATRVAVLYTCAALFSNCLILRPLQPFAISGTTHHMKQHHITKDLSVHNSSVTLNIIVYCAMAHVICHWPGTTETGFIFRSFVVRFVWTKWHSERFYSKYFSFLMSLITPPTRHIDILFIFDWCCV